MIESLIGGLIIGIAVSLNLLFIGRIYGLSGMIYTTVSFNFQMGFLWKFGGLVGMMSSILIVVKAIGPEISDIVTFLDDTDEFIEDLGIAGWLVGALFVGFGTKLGNGCTSGHGICGLARMSKRSLVAVCCFMSSAILMANIKPYIYIFDGEMDMDVEEEFYQVVICFIIYAILVIIWLIMMMIKPEKQEGALGFLSGFIFGAGLVISGMCKRSKIIGFLTFNQDWDPALILVMGGALLVAFPSYQYMIRKMDHPMMYQKFELPTNTQIDWKVIVGPIIFGLGWGITGLCPGPAYVSMFFYPQGLVMVATMLIGMRVAAFI